MMRVLIALGLVFAGCTQLPAQSYEQQLARSRSALNAKQYKEAQIAAEKAIQLDPNRWEGYVLAANSYSAQLLYDDAVGMLQIALLRAPEDNKRLIREALADARKRVNSSPVPTKSTAAQIPSSPSMQEIVLWKSIEKSSTPVELRAYLTQYPNGAFAVLASARLDADLKENTWVDSTTGLLWTRKGIDYKWDAAVEYCRDLRVGGFGDWRLPQPPELKSILSHISNDRLRTEILVPHRDSSVWTSHTTERFSTAVNQTLRYADTISVATGSSALAFINVPIQNQTESATLCVHRAER